MGLVKILFPLSDDTITDIMAHRKSIRDAMLPKIQLAALQAELDGMKKSTLSAKIKDAAIKDLQSQIDSLNTDAIKNTEIPAWAILDEKTGEFSVKVDPPVSPVKVEELPPLSWDDVLERADLRQDTGEHLTGNRIKACRLFSFGKDKHLSFAIALYGDAVNQYGIVETAMIGAYHVKDNGQFVPVSTDVFKEEGGRKARTASSLATGSALTVDASKKVVFRAIDVTSLPQPIIDAYVPKPPKTAAQTEAATATATLPPEAK